jgi:hypothetical protein
LVDLISMNLVQHQRLPENNDICFENRPTDISTLLIVWNKKVE